MATCSACSAPIIWAITEKDKKMPVDEVEPEPGGGNLVFTGGRSKGLPVVRYVPKGTGNRVSHFATCSEADRFRRR